jgi:hypothetical protein
MSEKGECDFMKFYDTDCSGKLNVQSVTWRSKDDVDIDVVGGKS